MSDIAEGAAEVAALVAEHPGLPVLFHGDGNAGEDWFVMRVRGARLGEFVAFRDRIYDARADLLDDLEDENRANAVSRPRAAAELALKSCPQGGCVWLDAEYLDAEGARDA